MLAMGFGTGRQAFGQDVPAAAAKKPDPGSALLPPEGRGLADDESGAERGIKSFAKDQRDLWTSPARIRTRDAKWLVILGGAAAGMFATDHAVMQRNTLSPASMRTSVDFSDLGLGALVGAGGGLYLWGKMTGDDHKQETGLLSGESAVDAFAASTILGGVFGRERPNVDGAQGKFFRGGSSFPSDHSAIAWSVASMIAHQYPGPLTKVFAYGLAGAVSVSRVTGNQHFPSDVFLGGAMGYFVAREIYQHHGMNLAGESGNPQAGDNFGNEFVGSQNLASPDVPLDSWVYPEMERLEALGYVQSGFLGMRPWTRTECARLVEEAGENLQTEDFPSSQAGRMYKDLAQEFAPEMGSSGGPEREVQVESLYTRMMGISGLPLTDGYHFGQTLINDYGRPYQSGFNPISGFSGWANWGRFALYVRGEYQHSPSAPAYSQQVRELIAQTDVTPLQPANPFSTINQFTLLDTYAVTKLANWDFSFGKQSLWWGPNNGGSLLLSNNAEPVCMFRIARDTPFTLPSILHRLGPMKVDTFVGELAGNHYPARPMFHGEKISFKPSENLELSISRTGEFGGVGRPLTLAAILNTYFSVRSSVLYPAWDNPGQRQGGADFSYRVPWLRNWLTVYGTAMSRDDVSPLAAFFPMRSLFNPGIYLPRIPHVPRLDFRFEGVDTNPPAAPRRNGQFAYWDNFYHDLYTNKNNLMGDWVGRTGTGLQGWGTYWFNPRTFLQVGYRHAQVASQFIPHGGTINDGSVKFNYQVGSAFTFSTFVQYENWLFQELAPLPKQNVTAALQITYWPRHWGLSK